MSFSTSPVVTDPPIIQSDNHSTVRWCLSSCSTLKFTAIERHALHRIASALGNELLQIRKICGGYEVMHLPGVQNAAADELSRVLSVGVKGQLSLPLFQLLNHATGLKEYPAADDLFVLAEVLGSSEVHDLCFEYCGPGCSRPPSGEAALGDQECAAPDAATLYVLQQVCPEASFILQEEDFVDRCFTLEEEPEDASQGHQPQTESYLVRRLGSDTWSIDQACRSISVLRWCLDAWLVAARDKTRRGPRSKDFQPFPRNWTREDLLVLLRADQGGNSAVCSLREKGFSEPYYDIDGLVTFRSSLSSGAVAFRPLVSSLIRDKLLRDVHRSHGHCGVDYMCGRVTQGFHAQRLRSAAALIKQHCVFCARFCASFPKTWTVPCGGPFFDLESLMALPAYSVVGIDFLSLAPKVKVLAVVCAATRHCSLFYTPQENSHCSLAAIKELCLLFGRPLCVYSDRASYFRSSYFLEGLEKMGIQNVHLASRSPFEGSLYERRNQEVRRLLRFFEELPVVRRLLAHFDASSVSDVTSLRRLLMEISLIMNQRPLGISRSGEDVNTICPDSLCFGYTRRTDQLSEPLFEVPNRPSVVDEGVPQAGVDMVIDSAAVRRGSTGYLPLGAQGSPPQRFSAVRNSFLSYHFQWLRDRSTRNVVRGVAKAGNVSIHFDEGDLVFVKSGKVIYPARVVQTLPGSDGVVRRLRVRNSKSGHESTVSHHNVVKSSIESSLQD